MTCYSSLTPLTSAKTSPAHPFSTSPRHGSLGSLSSSVEYERSTERLAAVCEGALPSQQQSHARPSSGVQPPAAMFLRGFNTLAAFLSTISSLRVHQDRDHHQEVPVHQTHQRKRGGTQQESIVIAVVVDMMHTYIRRKCAID